jgi:hypothetical protein
MSDEFDFDHVVATEVPVKIRGKKYVLREVGADAAVKYQDARMAATVWRPGVDGKPENRVASVEKLAETENLLVALCLFPADDNGQLPKDENGSPSVASVGMPFVKGLLDRIRDPLYKKVKEISPTLWDDTLESLTKEQESIDKRRAALLKNGTPEDQAKNSPDATTSISS